MTSLTVPNLEANSWWVAGKSKVADPADFDDPEAYAPLSERIADFRNSF